MWRLLDHVGPCVVVAHSQGGGFALRAAQIRPDLVRAVVALEPSGRDTPSRRGAPCRRNLIPVGRDRVREHMRNGRRYRDRPRRRLRARDRRRQRSSGPSICPRMGVLGNSHMLMMDANSDSQLAARVSAWLAEVGVGDRRNRRCRPLSVRTLDYRGID